MSGETNLRILLSNMSPVLNEGDYVFCIVSNTENIDSKDIINTFKEKEGMSIVITKEGADKVGLNYSLVMSWITLQIHSSLEAVGLTASFSKVLADNHISCNVIAGYYHDHIFVKKEDSGKAIEVLKSLSSL